MKTLEEELQDEVRKTIMKSINERSKESLEKLKVHEKIMLMADKRLNEVLGSKRNVLSFDEVLLREYANDIDNKWKCENLTIDDIANLANYIAPTDKERIFRKLVEDRFKITDKEDRVFDF